MTKEEIQKNSEHWYNKYKDAEKRIKELEQKLEQTEKDLADYQFNYPSIEKLSKENAELKEKLGDIQMQKAGEKSDLVWHLKTRKEELEQKNAELKDLIENIIRVTWGEGWNYSLDWKVKAENFLKEKNNE